MDNAFYQAAQVATYARTVFAEKFADTPLILRLCAHVHYDSSINEDQASIDMFFLRGSQTPVITFPDAQNTQQIDAAFAAVEIIEKRAPEEGINDAYEAASSVMSALRGVAGRFKEIRDSDQ